MLFEDTFKTISKPSQGSYREKGSKFLAFAYPVRTEEEIKEKLTLLRKEYFDARHHCYAYCLGPGKEAYRVNDDGEPSGSAGRPIYGQIQSFDLTNVLIVVIRYFGGVKLGIPGLINAYRTAAKEAIQSAGIVELTVQELYAVSFDYLKMNDVMKALKDDQVNISGQEFDNSCRITFSVRRSLSAKIISLLKNIEGVSVVFLEMK